MLKRFEKYHGLGNDFMLVEFDPHAEQVPWLVPEWSAGLVASVCDRHRGVGADGVIFCGVQRDGRVRMVIFNQDGSRPEMCGNGVRCVAAWALRRGLGSSRGDEAQGSSLCVLSDAGDRACRISPWDPSRAVQVAVGMGVPQVDKEAEDVVLEHKPLSVWRVDMGNPHAVVFLAPGEEMFSLEEIDRLGRAANHARALFAHGVNLEIAREVEAGVFEVIVYERGVGRTLACGTGACAVAVAAWRSGRAEDGEEVIVQLPGGGLTLWEDEQGEVWMTGPAEHVFDGEVSEAASGRVGQQD